MMMPNKDPEKQNEYSKKYRLENKEKINEYGKKYYQENKEKRTESYKKYYQENKEKINEHSKEYYQENKEKINEQTKQYRLENKEKWMCNTSKVRAKQKNLPFNLSTEYLKEIWPEDNKCPALGITMRKGDFCVTDHSPTLDRIIPKLGYIKGNVQVVSALANRIMSDATVNQVMAVAKHYEKITKELENGKKTLQQR
jgi:hypothetical protein